MDSVSYEREPVGGSSGIIFEDYNPSTGDRKLFRWSLINPPTGVRISKEGFLSWPDNRGYAREKPYEYTVRIEYDTPGGTVFNESLHSVRILPEPATNDFTELRPSLRGDEGGMLGFSLSEGDGWLAAGEPFPRFGFAQAGPKTGRVRLLAPRSRAEPLPRIACHPTRPRHRLRGFRGQRLNLRSAGRPPHPACHWRARGGSHDCGWSFAILCRLRICLFVRCGRTLAERRSVWIHRLSPHTFTSVAGYPSREIHLSRAWREIVRKGPTRVRSLYSGTMATAGFFRKLSNAPDPDFGDYFSFPCALDGEWIAAAANEDDDDGTNAGAVHLVPETRRRFVHRQRIGSPLAAVGTPCLASGVAGWSVAFCQLRSGRTQSTGAVHVFKQNRRRNGFPPDSSLPFRVAGSGFGLGLAISGNTLSVSAPGHLLCSGSSFRTMEIIRGKALRSFLLRTISGNGRAKSPKCPTEAPGRHPGGMLIAQPPRISPLPPSRTSLVTLAMRTATLRRTRVSAPLARRAYRIPSPQSSRPCPWRTECQRQRMAMPTAMVFRTSSNG